MGDLQFLMRTLITVGYIALGLNIVYKRKLDIIELFKGSRYKNLTLLDTIYMAVFCVPALLMTVISVINCIVDFIMDSCDWIEETAEQIAHKLDSIKIFK